MARPPAAARRGPRGRRRRRPASRPWRCVAGLSSYPSTSSPQSPISVASGSRRTSPAVVDARQAPDLFEQRPVERHDGFGLLVARLGRPQLERQDAVRLKSEVDPHQGVEAPEHQAGAEEQQHGDRRLDAREDGPQALPPRVRTDEPPRAVAQGLRQVEAEGLERGGEAEEERRREREGRREAAACRRRSRSARAPAARRSRATRGPGCPPRRAPRPSSGARRREHEALGQELSRQPPLPGADRGAHGDLALAPFGPREQQVGDVGAGHEHQEPDGAEDEHERPARAAADLFLDGNGEGLEAHLASDTVPCSVSAAVTIFSSALALSRRRALLQLRRAVVAVAAVVGRCGIDLRGDVELGRLGRVDREVGRQREAAGRDAHDAAGHAVELDRAPEDVRVSAVAVLPEPVSENDDGRAAVAILLGREVAAEPERRRRASRRSRP